VDGEHYFDTLADDVLFEFLSEFPGWPRVTRFLGLPWHYTWGSGRFSGVTRDAEYPRDISRTAPVSFLQRDKPPSMKLPLGAKARSADTHPTSLPGLQSMPLSNPPPARGRVGDGPAGQARR